jgi:hypothetical protein
MSPLMIPRHILEPILDDIIDYAKQKALVNPKINNYVICFEDIKKKQTFQEQYPEWEVGLIEGKRRLLRVDTHRNDLGKIESIFSQYPPLLEWWNSIKVDNIL